MADIGTIAADTAREVVRLTQGDFPFILAYTVAVSVLLRTAKGAGEGRAWLKHIMAAYNLIMCLFSFWSASVVFRALRILPVKTNDCDLWFESEPQTQFATVARYFYLSKYVEFADTLFLILGGKSVNWLHYIHHLGAPIDMSGLVASKSESIWIFILLNGTIHTLMYGYFGMSALGGRWRSMVSPFRVVMTSLQIVQFLAGFTIVFPYKDIPCFGASSGRMAFYYFTYFYVNVVLAFFIWFFISSYLFKGSKKSAGKKDE